MALLSHPICPGCGWLWLNVSPVVLLGLLVAIFVKQGTRPPHLHGLGLEHCQCTLILIVGLCVFILIPIPAYFAYCLILGMPFRPTAFPKLS